MKAKDCAKRILEYKDDNLKFFDEIQNVVKDLTRESMSIAESRNVKLLSSFLDILKEQDKKWRAVCRILQSEVDGLNMDYLENIFKIVSDRIISEYMKN